MMYGRGYGYPGYGGMMGGGWLAALFFALFGLLILALIAVLVIWAVRAASGHGRGQASAPSGPGSGTQPGAAGHDEAVAIAKKRLASGEIDPEQYAEIMRHLGG
jgi:uncharacterized membrane protein